MRVHRVGAWIALSLLLVARVAAADDAATLKYKLAKGDRVIYRTKSMMKQNQTIAGMAFENEMDTETIHSYTVDSIDEKGNYVLSVKGERLKMKAKFGALGDYSFDSQSSERDKSSTLGAAITPLFERLSGSVYHVVLSPEGDVVDVRGYADLIRDIVEGNSLAAQFIGGGTDESVRDQLKEVFPKLSKNPVKPGDGWDVPYEVALAKLGKVKGKNSYRYAGADKVGDRNTAKIDVVAEASITLDLDMDGAKVTGTLSTTAASGTIQFDPVAGRVLSGQSDVTHGGTLNVAAGGMDIPVQNEQNMKTKVEYLEKLPD
jgi:hypothetical protein